MRTSLRGLIDNLCSTVSGLHWKPAGTEWAEYYEHSNYGAAALGRYLRLGYFATRIVGRLLGGLFRVVHLRVVAFR